MSFLLTITSLCVVLLLRHNPIDYYRESHVLQDFGDNFIYVILFRKVVIALESMVLLMVPFKVTDTLSVQITVVCLCH